MKKSTAKFLEEELNEEIETLEERTLREPMKEYFCKYENSCEGYDLSCRIGERTLYDCPYAEKIIRAEKRHLEKGRRL